MIKTNPRGVKAIRAIARNLRISYGISMDEAFPIYDYLESLCDEGLLTIEIVENDSDLLDKGVVAIYNASDNFIYIKEQVLEDLDNNIYRSNFTLAHELFHYLQNQVFDFTFEEVNERKAFEDPEWQANEFAGELLVPTDSLDLSEDEIVSRYKVSLECALTRKVMNKKRNGK